MVKTPSCCANEGPCRPIARASGKSSQRRARRTTTFTGPPCLGKRLRIVSCRPMATARNLYETCAKERPQPMEQTTLGLDRGDLALLPASARRWRFAAFEVDPVACELWRGGHTIALRRKTWQLLCLFLANPHRLCTKEE